MEIILPGFNIEDAITSQWQSNIAKSEAIEGDRQDAEETATKALTQQFKRELDTYLDSNIQSSLNVKVIPPKEIAVLSVYAIFTYLNSEIILKRDSQNWEIVFGGKTIVTSPDLLQKTLLLELGRLKNEVQSR